MKEIAGLEVAIFVWFLFFTPASVAADGPELAEMESAVLAAGGDWDAIEALLDTLSPEDRELVIATYPERIAELELVRQAIEESGANWTAGLNSVSILPPELRPGTGLLSLSAKEGDLSREVVRISASEDGPAALALPEGWDWRSISGADWTTPIKDQEQCGSCWAFGALAAYEARMKLAATNHGLMPDLSEQHLVSCSPGSCSGGYMDVTADWIVCNGTVDEICFPYIAMNGSCYESCFDRDSRKYKGEGWSWASGDRNIIDEDRIKQEILAGGPVAAAMDVYTDFYIYNGGVYQYTTGAFEGGHCVAIVGWGKEGSTDYWICKNSWGTEWGEAGWFRIKMGEVNIGLEAVAYQPKVRGKVLFYEGHAPVYLLLANYSEWGNRLAGNGYLVHSSDDFPLTAELLECYDVVVIGNPDIAFTADELAAIKEFVGRGRVIAAGDGDLFENAFIYKQDNVKAAVQYVDWLASGNGGGLLLLGGEDVDWLPQVGPAEGPAPLVTNEVINQMADLFGLHFNADTVSDPLRYDGAVTNAILGPKEDILVINASSLAISKDAFPLARTTPSGYVTAAAGADPEAPPQEADVEVAITPEAVMAAAEALPAEENGSVDTSAGYEIPPEEMPPAGEVPPGGELAGPAGAPEEDEELEASSDPVPMAGLSFTGPIVIAAADFGRKGEDAVGVFRNGAWFLDYDNDGVPDEIIGYGTTGDLPVSGDWNGDGKDEIGVLRSGVWFLDYDNDGVPDEIIGYGMTGDLPVSGDWNGDGKDTIGVFRNGVWFLDYDNDGVPDEIIGYGMTGDLPVSGDWNGDGKDTIGVFRNGVWFLDYDNDGVPDEIITYGTTGDRPVSGDWNGDGTDGMGVLRNGVWFLDYDNNGEVDKIMGYGTTGDLPTSGDWYKIP
jgi:hypothetical protein